MQEQAENLWFGLFQCELCGQQEFISRNSSQILEHLREEHSVEVWREEEEVRPFLDLYLERKQDRFMAATTFKANSGKSGADSVDSVDMGGGGGIKTGPLDRYYWGGEHDFEGFEADQELRSSCRLSRLTSVLQIQEGEITFTNQTPIACLFCKKFTSTSRTNLFSHFYQEHSLLIGSVHNLVFVQDFLGMLQKRLDERICLYCEKQFPDHITLRSHMRKKKHFQINPKNRDYDRFYIKNYKEREDGPKLTQGVLQLNLGEDNNGEEEEEADWTDWDELCQEGETQCLFDDTIHSSAEECHNHMVQTHSFSLFSLNLDFYERIRLVNYLRYYGHSCTCYMCKHVCADLGELSAHFGNVHGNRFTVPPPDDDVWVNPSFLFPYIEGDALLMLDIGADVDADADANDALEDRLATLAVEE